MKDTKVTIEDMREVVRRFRQARHWDVDQNTKNKAISLVIEAVEFLEHFQWRETDEVLGRWESKEGLVDELADVFYWVLTLADSLDVELNEALLNKLKKANKKYPAKLFRSGSEKQDLATYYRLRDRARQARLDSRSARQARKG